MSSTVKVLRAKLASCCLSCYLVPPSSAKSPPPPPTLSAEEQLNSSSTSPLHSRAFYRHSAPSTSRLYQCPQCQTSLPDMSHQWLLMDNERASWVMPQHLKDFKVKVQCRDCREEGDATYHVVGLKCPSCGSYNTVRSGNEEIPLDATVVNQLIQQRRRRRRQRRRRRESRQERNGGGGMTSSTSSESDSEEGDNHRSQHRSSSDSDEGEDPVIQSQPRPQQQDNGSRRHGGAGGGDDNGEDPAVHPPNEADDNSQSYDGDASENDDIDSSSDSSRSSDRDSDSDYYEARRSRTYVSFAQRGYSVFFSPIEVPVGLEPGALEWWQDPNDSELEPRTAHRDHDQRPPPLELEPLEGREECDNGGIIPTSLSSDRHQRVQERSHQFRGQSEPHLVPDELNSPTEVRRRAIAQSIVQNMRLWNSDSDSFSELSSEDGEEEKSSDSWVTEEEEVIVGMRGSELQEQEEVEPQGNEEGNCRDLPTTTTTMGDIVIQVQSESGVESAESWFTSSDHSHSLPCSHEQDKHTTSIPQSDSGIYSNETSTMLDLEGQRKVERSSVCSSISTDDSLAWETACEDLPASSVCSYISNQEINN